MNRGKYMDTQPERRRIFGVVAISLALLVQPVTATTITVSSTVDALANTGSCTLREAIIAANQNAPSGAAAGECPAGSSGSTDTILLPSGTFQLSLSGTESSGAVLPALGDLDITQNVNIVGQGPASTIVDALGLGARLFHIDFATSQISFQGLTLRNGVSNGSGGGIYFRDGVSLSLTNVRVLNNSATSGNGGGIYAPNTSNVTLTDVQIVGNSTEDHGGGLNWNECVGCTSNTLTITRSLIALNTTTENFFAEGGGISAGTGNIFITDSTIDENHATSGGGIRLEGSLFAASSTFSNNTADFDGGGIFFDFHDFAQLTNCTITNNEADGAGGGIASFSNETSTLTNCTIAENKASSGTAIDRADELVLINTIVSGTCSDGLAVSQGGNVESPGDNCGLDHATDLVAVGASSLGLAPLADNGGRTLTHLIGDSSVARGRGRDAFCPSLDQTGMPRPSVGNCDAGSVEAGARLVFADGFESGNLSAWQ
jgi:CSLREA domain-containing protein